ncbi:MAG: type II toxin-antitoxin system RelE/ParE family toxin [Spirochaetia bacterium]|nr:type II toxin-antitoxin system RelE/ParE family toxin [Spirochaetia bacterium]
MISSWKDEEAKKVFLGIYSKRLPHEIQRNARKKLIMIDSSVDINDLRIPPSNRLHKLTGDRKEQYSVSINNQWRICFNWENNNAFNLEICDYH